MQITSDAPASIARSIDRVAVRIERGVREMRMAIDEAHARNGATVKRRSAGASPPPRLDAST